jgi:ribose-phosphate pyrophosphokinase
LDKFKNKDCIIIDDMIDTAGTITNVAKALKEKNAKNIYAFCTHAVLSGKAIERINNSEISKLVTTNTINKDIYPNTTDLISVADIFSQAIYNVHTEQSINSLFK